MFIIKQDDTKFSFLKSNAFSLKGRIIIILEYQVFGQYVLLGIWGGAAWTHRQPKLIPDCRPSSLQPVPRSFSLTRTMHGTLINQIDQISSRSRRGCAMNEPKAPLAQTLHLNTCLIFSSTNIILLLINLK